MNNPICAKCYSGDVSRSYHESGCTHEGCQHCHEHSMAKYGECSGGHQEHHSFYCRCCKYVWTEPLQHAPAVGAEMACLLCSRVRPWGTWHPSGVAVCVECRDAARSACEDRAIDALIVLAHKDKEARP